jgi:thiamine pyridinylase
MIFSVLVPFALLSGSVFFPGDLHAANNRRQLRVVLYPFIPEFASAAETVKKTFEANNPDIELTILDLSSNYYGPGDATYVGQVDADVIELDSVFLADFVHKGKIQELPQDFLLPPSDLLSNAYRGSMLNGKRYGAAHWACRNFLFFPSANKPSTPIEKLSQLQAFLDPNKDGTLLMDMRGKLTLGELYLMAAFDRYKDWAHVAPAVQTLDSAVEDDLIRLSKLCPHGGCRDQIFHEITGIYGQEFARKRSKALVGYSELLRSVLLENLNCPADCIGDADLDVADIPLDEAGSVPISWVDSFTVATSCKGDCFTDARKFVQMMNSEDMYFRILLPFGLSFLKSPVATEPVPAYLLPARVSLYSNPKLLASAHLYPKLRLLVENAEVPTSDGLNDLLRVIGKKIDSDLDKKN